ncbi:hypothetical protein RSK20926_19377 [Roseobacter sp. SK209-2-6]|uniref:lipocalin-like domain-containing protein n=1 Tax=Roseobacter sp. SK209-2-6 TaxID=388739 RepID=UPI0000F3F647|nr:lipocalin-like domain-containing protein [Roseobacter sp. SK209-2-6]EBA17932.1 hypothetical protein RSK20926_19377 [Roseobacter sp. SK209-2-6]
MIARSLLLICLLQLPADALAQGFAGLGTQAEGFAVPSRDYQFSFPDDHGPHPDFRIEWWYLTANLKDNNGRDYGVQWTLFRSALKPGEAPGWQSPQIWMGHAGLTTMDQHFSAERLARGGTGQAGVTSAPFEAWIDDWHMAGSPDLSHIDLTARGSNFSFLLQAESNKPLVFHGQDGYSVKSAAGQASYYYSQPAYRITGHLDLPDGTVEVQGSGWLDREWSSQPLAEDQEGWDWFSLKFDSGEKLMAFVLRSVDGQTTFALAAGSPKKGVLHPLPLDAFTALPLETSEVTGRSIPTKWKLNLPGQDLEITVIALNNNSWMETSFAYWEGPVRIEGSHSGMGYLEMTGYEK